MGLMPNSGRFQPLSLQILFQPHVLPPCLWDWGDKNVGSFVVFPQVSEALFISVFCQFLAHVQFGRILLSVLKFTGSVPGYLYSAIEAILQVSVFAFVFSVL